MTTSYQTELDAPFTIGREHIAFFRENGYLKLKHVLPPDLLAFYGAEITRLVIELNTQHLPLEQRDTYGRAFLQVMNLHEHSPLARAFVMSKRLGQIAANLLEVSGVRLYHDQALYKEAGGGITPWHADQYYWPLSSDRTVTVWIPLQETPPEMGPLVFCAKSQTVDLGRALPIDDESERQIQAGLEAHHFEVIEAPFDLGEVSFHLGWTFHRAGANHADRPRAVMTMIYMDKDMRLAQPVNQNQIADWNQWCPGVMVGAVIDSPKNPVIYAAQ